MAVLVRRAQSLRRLLSPSPRQATFDPKQSRSSRSFLFSTASASENPNVQHHPEPPTKQPSDWLRGKFRELRQELKQVPPLARTLGLAGAVPFVALSPPIVYVLPLPELLYSMHAEAQAAYGAVILSFLGGPHWGLAMAGHNSDRPVSLSGYTAATTRYVWGVTPCLLGWLALLLPPVSKFCVLIPSFVLALVVDFVMASSEFLPPWYLPLRMFLSGVAVLSMGASLLLLLVKDLPQAIQQRSSAEKNKP